jgi:hypothetical protein
LAYSRNRVRKGFCGFDMDELRHSTTQLREWLSRILGPTAHVENYSDDYARLRFRNMLGFYGSTIIRSWGGHRNWA